MVVETPFGLHLIQVTDKSPAGLMTYDKVKDRLREFLLMKAKRERVLTLVTDLRKSAKVEVY